MVRQGAPRHERDVDALSEHNTLSLRERTVQQHNRPALGDAPRGFIAIEGKKILCQVAIPDESIVDIELVCCA